MTDVQVIAGPSFDESSALFQVTLPNGAILTRAFEFGPSLDVVQRLPLVGENGDVFGAESADERSSRAGAPV